jgi:PAS domain S-box-containing protein
VKVLTNPILLRAAVVFFCSACAFVMGLIFIRLLRKAITDEADITSGPPPSLETLPLHIYSSVIQQLKQQRNELQVQSQTEQQRARASETFSQSVLSNLPCGVLVFGTNGLVTTSNPAAKEILGFGATTSMSIEDIFRGAVISASDEEPLRLADEVEAVLHGGDPRRLEAEYETPADEKRFFSITVSPVPTAEGSLLGVACLINDLSELDRIRRHQQVQDQLSAEKAQPLRASVAKISGYTQQLASSSDLTRNKRLADGIADEAAQLDRCLNEFLAEKHTPQSAAASAGANH